MDDLFGHRIARRGLTGKDDRARLDAGGTCCTDAVIARDHLKKVEQLALVLVDAFDVQVEERCGIDIYAKPLADFCRQKLLVGPFYGGEFGAERLIARE